MANICLDFVVCLLYVHTITAKSLILFSICTIIGKVFESAAKMFGDDDHWALFIWMLRYFSHMHRLWLWQCLIVISTIRVIMTQNAVHRTTDDFDQHMPQFSSVYSSTGQLNVLYKNVN